jgi:predicted nucleic acid-binding protein
MFVAFANASDRDHARAVKVFDKVRRGEHGQPYSSDYVLDEAVTTALARTRRVDTAIRVGKLILGAPEQGIPPLARLLRVDEIAFSGAWDAFKSGRHPQLSFTDHTILLQVMGIKDGLLATFDSGFDGLVPLVR